MCSQDGTNDLVRYASTTGQGNRQHVWNALRQWRPGHAGKATGPGNSMRHRRLLGWPEDCAWKAQDVSNTFRWYRTYSFVPQNVVNCFFFFFLKKYLFIWLHQVLVAAPKIYFFQYLGLLIFVVACKIFSCSMMWDLVPWPEIEPRPPALGMRSLSHWTTREVITIHSFFFFLNFFFNSFLISDNPKVLILHSEESPLELLLGISERILLCNHSNVAFPWIPHGDLPSALQYFITITTSNISST